MPAVQPELEFVLVGPGVEALVCLKCIGNRLLLDPMVRDIEEAGVFAGGSDSQGDAFGRPVRPSLRQAADINEGNGVER